MENNFRDDASCFDDVEVINIYNHNNWIATSKYYNSYNIYDITYKYKIETNDDLKNE